MPPSPPLSLVEPFPPERQRKRPAAVPDHEMMSAIDDVRNSRLSKSSLPRVFTDLYPAFPMVTPRLCSALCTTRKQICPQPDQAVFQSRIAVFSTACPQRSQQLLKVRRAARFRCSALAPHPRLIAAKTRMAGTIAGHDEQIDQPSWKQLSLETTDSAARPTPRRHQHHGKTEPNKRYSQQIKNQIVEHGYAPGNPIDKMPEKQLIVS
jgi:hypothetical protein